MDGASRRGARSSRRAGSTSCSSTTPARRRSSRRWCRPAPRSIPWHGQTLVSLVGFRFEDTRLAGLPIPGHRRFDEVNLRFYVRRIADDGSVRRAVVFIRELVPRWAIAAVARWIYNEPYLSRAAWATPSTSIRAPAARSPIAGSIAAGASRSAPASAARRRRSSRAPKPSSSPSTTGATRGSATAARSSTKWRTRAGRCGRRTSARFEGAADRLYGPDFAQILAGPPQSAFVAVGSPVSVFRGRRLDLARRRAGDDRRMTGAPSPAHRAPRRLHRVHRSAPVSISTPSTPSCRPRATGRSGIPKDGRGQVHRPFRCRLGVYAPDGAQVGFARVITDYATFAYLCDVYVLDAHRGRGLGAWLTEFVLGAARAAADPSLDAGDQDRARPLREVRLRACRSGRTPTWTSSGRTSTCRQPGRPRRAE